MGFGNREDIVKRGDCHIGTSGWHYNDWLGPFYPDDIHAKDFLTFYADHFKTVEINNSFYHLPKRETFEQWRVEGGKGFLFAVKASRYITHMKKLKDPEEGLSNFLDAADGLGKSLGPVLFQLPPRWHVNTERLNNFLEKLPKDLRCAFEFRDETWFDEKVYKLLAEFNAAFCIYDLGGRESPEKLTADYVYVRLHGPGGKYEGNYSVQKLKSWGKKFDKWMADGKDVYCYFDNDQKGYAVKNAITLIDIIDGG